jgi:hypothetical protein
MSIYNGPTNVVATGPSRLAATHDEVWTLLINLHVPFCGCIQVARRPAHWTHLWSYLRKPGSLEVWAGRFEFLLENTRAHEAKARRGSTRVEALDPVI